MKKKCVIGFFGLYRTFEITSQNIREKLINYNKNDFDFEIVICTDLLNNNLSKWNENKSKFNYTQEILEEKLHLSYNKNNELKKIIYLNLEDTNNKSSGYIISKRIEAIMNYLDSNNNKYDLYIMMRIDVILNDPVNLNDYLNDKNSKYKKIGNITHSKYDIKRLDHWRDYDFCWISDRIGILYYFYLIPKNIDNIEYNIKNFTEFSKMVFLKSTYAQDCIDSNEILKEPFYMLWLSLFRLYINGYIMTFESEEKNIFLSLVR